MSDPRAPLTQVAGSSIEEPGATAMIAVPGYQVVRELGQGGSGVVYLAWEEALERFVALKVVAPHHLEPEWELRFEREALALARVQHPNVVPVHAFGRCPDGRYLVLGYVLGETLANALAGANGDDTSRLAEWFARHDDGDRRHMIAATVVAMAIADALDDVHSVGIVHRDIKPSNILIDAKGRPILCDFGVACDPNSARLVPEEGTSGTLRFMAPEQIDRPAHEIDHRADLYALGVVLYEMLTLRPALSGEDLGEMIDTIQNRGIPSPREVDPSVPEVLDRIVRKATALEPGDRFQSARGMCHALRAAARELGHPAALTALALGPDLQRAFEPRDGATDDGDGESQRAGAVRGIRGAWPWLAAGAIASAVAFALGRWSAG